MGESVVAKSKSCNEEVCTVAAKRTRKFTVQWLVSSKIFNDARNASEMGTIPLMLHKATFKQRIITNHKNKW